MNELFTYLQVGKETLGVRLRCALFYWFVFLLKLHVSFYTISYACKPIFFDVGINSPYSFYPSMSSEFGPIAAKNTTWWAFPCHDDWV